MRRVSANARRPMGFHQVRARRPKAWSCRPTAEALEDRTVPSFLPPVTYPGGADDLVTEDFNNDSVLDLATTHASLGTVNLLFGNPDGSFQVGGAFATGLNPLSPAVADFNGDGNLDVVTAHYGFGYGEGSLSVLLGNGDGTLQPPLNFTLPQAGNHPQKPQALAVADMNHDGMPDLVATADGEVVTDWSCCVYKTYVHVLLGVGNGTFNAGSASLLAKEAYGFTSLELGDLNADGKVDVVTSDYTFNSPAWSTKVFVQLGKGNGTLGVPKVVSEHAQGYLSLAMEHLNADSKLDLVIGNFGAGTVSLLLGKGDGTFLNGRVVLTETAVSAVAAADFNADGKIDIIATDEFAGSVKVLLGNGTGRFQRPKGFPAGVNPRALAVGDFNGDGFPDLAVATYGSSFCVLLNDGDWTS